MLTALLPSQPAATLDTDAKVVKECHVKVLKQRKAARSLYEALLHERDVLPPPPEGDALGAKHEAVLPRNAQHGPQLYHLGHQRLVCLLRAREVDVRQHQRERAQEEENDEEHNV